MLDLLGNKASRVNLEQLELLDLLGKKESLVIPDFKVE